MRHDSEYYSAREEAEWLSLRIKFYTSVVLSTIVIVLMLMGSLALGIFVDPAAFVSIILPLGMIMIPAFGYGEYGQEFHTQRILRKREREAREEAQKAKGEVSLEEAERIVAAFAKGK